MKMRNIVYLFGSKKQKKEQMETKPAIKNGDALRRLRTRLGLSQAELSRQTGVPQASISRWEMGAQMSFLAQWAFTGFALENLTELYFVLHRDADQYYFYGAFFTEEDATDVVLQAEKSEFESCDLDDYQIVVEIHKVKPRVFEYFDFPKSTAVARFEYDPEEDVFFQSGGADNG